jgi:hypothetical protein
MSVAVGMDLSRIHKKMSETEFFLGKMVAVERGKLREPNSFDYYLSAFLSAGKTVDNRLCHEHTDKYKPWRKRWYRGLPKDDRKLFKFMIDDRNIEVHESGSTRKETLNKVTLMSGEHPMHGGTASVVGPPGVPLAEATFSTFSFTIDGTEHRATTACAEYLGLLKQMVEQFEARHRGQP